MKRDSYLLYRDGLGRFLLQNTDTGIVEGLLWGGLPGESARAFSYDYGSIWYPEQIVNLVEFPELAKMPFFAIESGGLASQYFRDSRCQNILPIVGATAKLWGYYVCPEKFIPPCQNLCWQYKLSNPDGLWTMPVFSVWVNHQGCWGSNRSGWILGLNHQGELIQQFKLKQFTRYLTSGFPAQDHTPLVSCEDGFIYDLTGKLPESIYSLPSPIAYAYQHIILALAKSEDFLFITDVYGQLLCVNAVYKTQWQKHSPHHWLSFFLATDHDYLYQGYYRGVIAYVLATGNLLWEIATPAPVLCGVALDDVLILGCGDRQIYQVKKFANETSLSAIFRCSGIPYTIIKDSELARLLIADSDGKIYHLNYAGVPQELTQIPRGAVLAMQIWQNRLYAGTSEGEIICLNLNS
jgi:hypothetical protein